MRYRVAMEFHVEATTQREAIEKAKKLAEVLNQKDKRNRAWVKMMKEHVDDINVGDIYKGKEVI